MQSEIGFLQQNITSNVLRISQRDFIHKTKIKIDSNDERFGLDKDEYELNDLHTHGA